MKMLFLTALATLFSLATTAQAHEFTKGDLVVTHPMILETTPIAKSAGGYLSVTNTGSSPERLVGIRADVPRSMLHETVITDGVAKMEHRDGFDIAPGETLTLEPGAKHVMFMGLSKGLPAGAKVEAVLIFETAGDLPVTFNVEARGEGHDKDMDHGEMNHTATN